MNIDFWHALAQFLDDCPLIIDRERGSTHPRYPDIIYPLDYGYLEGTKMMDGGGLDVWRGTQTGTLVIRGVLCVVDLYKHDVELKLLVNCSPHEINEVLHFTKHTLHAGCWLIEPPHSEDKN